MLEDLTHDLLDLTASEKGYRGAMYAQNQDTNSGCWTMCLVLCCFLCHLCW